MIGSVEPARVYEMRIRQSQLVDRDGHLWRWDGFTRPPGSAATAEQLRQKNRLAQLGDELDVATAEFRRATTPPSPCVASFSTCRFAPRSPLPNRPRRLACAGALPRGVSQLAAKSKTFEEVLLRPCTCQSNLLRATASVIGNAHGRASRPRSCRLECNRDRAIRSSGDSRSARIGLRKVTRIRTNNAD